jgi:hypothetical protein
MTGAVIAVPQEAGIPAATAAPASLSRSPYALATWRALAGRQVVADLGRGRSTALTLLSVADLRTSEGDGDVFTLTFGGGAPIAHEGTYRMQAPSIGSFHLFLSSVDDGDFVSAVIDRRRVPA